MKKFCVIIIVFIALSIQTNAQFRKDNFEIGITGSLGSLNASNVNLYSQNYSTYNFTFLSGFAGYYIFDGFSVEPEFGIFAVENTTPAQFIIGNISYTKLRKNSPFAFFGKIGVGLSNSIILTYIDKPLIVNPDNFDTKIISLGMGVKYVADPQIVLRGEFNYKFQSRSVTAGPINNVMYNLDAKYETFSIVFGAAFLL